MTWKKTVQLIAVSACPRCGNAGFDLEPGEDLDDPDARIRCSKCGYVCAGGEFLRPVQPQQVHQAVDRSRDSGKPTGQPGAFQFSSKWASRVRALPETGMGYSVIRITLHDGRMFRQVLVDGGVASRVRGLPDIPFREADISDLEATHEKWDWTEIP